MASETDAVESVDECASSYGIAEYLWLLNGVVAWLNLGCVTNAELEWKALEEDVERSSDSADDLY